MRVRTLKSFAAAGLWGLSIVLCACGKEEKIVQKDNPETVQERDELRTQLEAKGKELDAAEKEKKEQGQKLGDENASLKDELKKMGVSAENKENYSKLLTYMASHKISDVHDVPRSLDKDLEVAKTNSKLLEADFAAKAAVSQQSQEALEALIVQWDEFETFVKNQDSQGAFGHELVSALESYKVAEKDLMVFFANQSKLKDAVGQIEAELAAMEAKKIKLDDQIKALTAGELSDEEKKSLVELSAKMEQLTAGIETKKKAAEQAKAQAEESAKNLEPLETALDAAHDALVDATDELDEGWADKLDTLLDALSSAKDNAAATNDVLAKAQAALDAGKATIDGMEQFKVFVINFIDDHNLNFD